MERIIVYGLGKLYKQYEDIISKRYEVIGFCDKDYSKAGEKFICTEELVKKQDLIDFILVTSAYGPSIYPELISVGVKQNKIKFLCNENYYNLMWNCQPEVGVTFSGGGEDIIAGLLLKEKWMISNNEVRYIELGVNDPVYGSNTYYFYKNGGSGVLVEANPNFIDVIKGTRARDVVLNKAVYKTSGDRVEFYLSDNSGLSSLNGNHLNMSDDWKRFSIQNKIMVETISINDIFMELPSVDILSIDLEGYDLEALRELDFERYRPKVIIAELNWTNVREREYYSDLFEFIISQKYASYYYNEYNGIFYDLTKTKS